MSSLILLLGLLVFVGVSSGAPKARDQTRIVGGTKSAQGKWPIFAGIFYNAAVKGYEPLGGGVVWDKDTVLTAAHCIENRPSTKPELFEIYLGHNDWTGEMDEAYLFKAKEIFTHPNFMNNTVKNDLAVIRLDRSIDFDFDNNKVECVCDPEPLDLLDTSKCVTMGWGRNDENRRSNTLLEVVIPILDNAFCAKRYSRFDPNSLVCAGLVKSQIKGICDGDSGGPLVCPQKAHPRKYSLVGIASFGSQPVCGTKPGYFTKVEHYLEWIGRMTAPVTTKKPTNRPKKRSFWQKLKGWFVGKVKHDELRK